MISNKNRKLKIIAVVSFSLFFFLFFVYQKAKPSNIPFLPKNGRVKLSKIVFSVINAKTFTVDRLLVKKIFSEGWDLTGSMGLFYKGRWYLATADNPVDGFVRLMERLRKYPPVEIVADKKDKTKKNVKKIAIITNKAEVGKKSTDLSFYFTLLGPTKSIPFASTALWNFTMIPGVDGIMLKTSRGIKFILPEEAASHYLSGGQVFSFLPLRFGLKRERIKSMLQKMSPLKIANSGKMVRLKNSQQRVKLKYPLLRFRSLSFFAESKDGQVSTQRIYRLAKLVPEGGITSVPLKSIIAAGDWFINHQRKNGSFSYRYQPYSGKVLAYNYSLPRHAGSIMILYRFYKHTGLKRFLDAADLGYSFLERKIGKSKLGDFIQDGYHSGKLGTTALTTLALLFRRDATLDDKMDTQLKSFLAFLANMQKPDGSFGHYYHTSHGIDKKKMGQNFSGQALWALAKGSRLFNLYKKKFVKGMNYQALEFWNFPFASYYFFPFSWEMQGIVDALGFVKKDIYKDFLFKAANSMVESQYMDRGWPFPDYFGGFGTPEWFGPLAHAAGFMGEGLAAAYDYANKLGYKKKALEYKKALQLAAGFILAQQVTKETAVFYKNQFLSIGAVRGGVTDHRQQIDYTQHAFAAILNIIETGVLDVQK